MDPIKVVDNLLSFISMKEMMFFDCHIDKAQEILQKHDWIVDSLKYLKLAREGGASITLAHSEWIDKLFPNQEIESGS